MTFRIAPALGCSLVIALWSMIAAAPPAARADVVFDNFDAGGGFHPQSNLVAAAANSSSTTNRLAVQFQVGTGGAGFTLDSITLPISQSAGAPNVLRVRLAADAGGTPPTPGATIEVLSLNQPVPPFSNPFTTTTTFNSVTHPLLSAGVRYWIVTELSMLPGASVDYRWYFNTSGPTVPVRSQQQSGGLTADPWVGGSGNFGAAFRVNGTPLLVACCNRATGACGLVEPTTCQGLGLMVVAGSQTCQPSPCPPACPGDFNRSGGSPTVQDIFDFLAAYFAGCI
ncbi:MAG: hypothetical protein IT438_16710 [Phycisphaerales bacterium]|nr:hypothetical protein [Phycisphaerales bacterium]